MRYIWILIFNTIAATSLGQNKSEYGLMLVDELWHYQHLVDSLPDNKMVDLKQVDGLHFDIRYATANNFTQQVIYPKAEAFARQPVANALENANRAFQKKGYSIKIWDAYRPYAATVLFYELIKDTTFVASPFSGSRHNRGCALDLTLVNNKTGKEVPMPTTYDDFTELAYPSSPLKDPILAKNRTLLIETMQEYGFEVYPTEWWHFDFKGWKDYPILNLTFDELKKNK
ncbi:MAG: D-alanyl-D-alanine dipeptidase [Verrucomicrobia bacterium]|nr:D-alanyl-D-alanine dipeptidase [Verrucomicrobiota bacterium]